MGQKLTPEQRAIVDGLADWVVRRGMTVPAILFLETVKPLSYVGSQVVVFFSPVLEVLFSSVSITAFQGMMEDRNNVELLLREIERRDAEAVKKQKEAKAREKAMRKTRKEARKLAKRQAKERKK
jgi:hypothetical protein